MAIQKKPVARAPLPPRQGKSQTYVSSKEAAEALGIKLASLYAYVSRGIVRSIVLPGQRKRLYYREDIERAGKRMGGRAGIPPTVEAALSWGQPLFQTALTELTEEGVSYRGRPVIELANSGRSFESVAELLWGGMDLPQLAFWNDLAVPPGFGRRLAQAVHPQLEGPFLRSMALATSLVAVQSREGPDFERGSTVSDARQLIALYAGSAGFLGPASRFVAVRKQESVAEILLRALKGRATPEAVRAINFALILCADHEMSPATVSARIAASCAAELRACLLAAIGAHSGTLLAGGCDRAESVLRSARDADSMHALMVAVGRSGARIHGYNIKAYPQGDPRARALLDISRDMGAHARRIHNLVSGVEAKFDLRPSLEVGLIALCVGLDLPVGSASAVWSLGRVAGWVAHVIEQRQAGFMVRPRARYMGQQRAPAG